MPEDRYIHRANAKGVTPLVYWLARAVLQPFFHLYFRVQRIGREHIPAEGGFIIAANHRSFLDPFIIGIMVRRPIYFVAKRELFESSRLQAWFLNSLGAFPINRGSSDEDAMSTARAILERGDGVLIFPEGTRNRPGSIGSPKRGVGRLALETGVPVVPLSIIGTERIRAGWKVRPHKVRVRAGRALMFPRVSAPSPALAEAVTSRIWPCVALQWEWLGGTPPVRRVVVVGAGSWGTGVAVGLARAGVEVELGCRTAEQAAQITATRESRYLPGVTLPAAITATTCAQLDLARADLVVLAVPSRRLPAAVAAHGSEIPSRAGVLVLTKGLVADGPRVALPAAYVAERTSARAVAVLGGPGHALDAVENGASLVVASADAGWARQLAELFGRGGFDAERSTDITGVELAGTAKNAAVLAAATASAFGPNAAGAAAGKVFAEVDALARLRGGRPETFAGLAGAGDLVATVVAQGSRNRRAGELLGAGTPAADIEPRLGQAAESLHVLPLLAAALAEEGVRAPVTEGLAAVVAGEGSAEDWAHGVTHPVRKRPRAA